MYDFVDQKRVVSFTLAVIFFILAIFGPAALLLPFKNGFITREAQAIGTSGWSLITGGVGLLAVSGIFMVFATVEKTSRKVILTLVLLLVAVLGIVLSSKDYYYYTPERFVISPPFSLTSHTYEWDDFEQVDENLTKEGGTLTVKSVDFLMKDGTRYSFDRGVMIQRYQPIIFAVQNAGGKYVRKES
ncbi:hypothetical protein [Edaphobacillus lindanitolerans]|uniref:Uncharacterized protein n=1 Tax=Edaphobacillus lindanitolerans TaxID=550447 RepID=A0A1U7PST1_9BACI|nr:hypothetical protein [Edaphobacillus lindanitolerans]SIT90752.1 hypothetical protein SAMN05428946_2513 [Edaphobacillus lindanitolerans]